MLYVNWFVQILKFYHIYDELTNRAEICTLFRLNKRRAFLHDLNVFDMLKKNLTFFARFICVNQ